MTLIEVVSKLLTQRGTTENKRDLCVCILSIHRVKKVNNVILAFRTAGPRNDITRSLLPRVSLLTGWRLIARQLEESPWERGCRNRS